MTEFDTHRAAHEIHDFISDNIARPGIPAGSIMGAITECLAGALVLNSDSREQSRGGIVIVTELLEACVEEMWLLKEHETRQTSAHQAGGVQ